jgi:molybdopterin converting factor small subunit
VALVITVRLPAGLGGNGPRYVTVTEPVSSVAALVEVLARRMPELSERLHDSVFNFVVNGKLVEQDVLRTSLNDGDVVELVPAESGTRHPEA